MADAIPGTSFLGCDVPTRRRWVVEGLGTADPRTGRPSEPMALQEALHAAQHLADKSGEDVAVRLVTGTLPASPEGTLEPDVASADLVVRPQGHRTDAPRPVPQPPASPTDRAGAWTVTLVAVLNAELARDDEAAVDQAVSALFSNGPKADLQAALTRPDGTHRWVALRPLDEQRPTPS